MKKRVYIVILIMLFMFTGCGQDRKLYKEAKAVIEDTELKLDGSNEMTESIVVALENAEYKEAKNIIFMIGDGMGYNILEATETVYSDKLYKEKLSMNYLPTQSSQSTYSLSDQITDSAAGGTALSTGYKTMNYIVGKDKDANESYETVLEIAARKGKSTGVVVTDYAAEATPATFTAHVKHRNNREEVAKQQLQLIQEGKLQVLLGGGRSDFETAENSGIIAANSELSYMSAWEDTVKSELPVLGLYAEGQMDSTDETQPSLAEMTDFAIQKLSSDEDGFFLMVEGSQIDDYGEYNELEREMLETYEFDCAVAIAMRYVALHPDTVLIITADHDTGDLEFPVAPDTDTIIKESTYGTTGHIYKNVPLLAVGYRTEELNGIQENTDVAQFVASLMDEEIGHDSVIHSLMEKDNKVDYTVLAEANPTFLTKLNKKTINVTFDTEHDEFQIPIVEAGLDGVEYAKVFHLKIKNVSEHAKALPELRISYMDKHYVVKPQKTYLKANETMLCSYVLPEDIWLPNALARIESISLAVEQTDVTYQFCDFAITERKGGK